ncbi:MAG TPA: hypothetical protein VD867_04405 [Burkholderiales bacterium]|nr:hypothetical protein [Burkholderiales bacterium]
MEKTRRHRLAAATITGVALAAACGIAQAQQRSAEAFPSKPSASWRRPPPAGSPTAWRG